MTSRFNDVLSAVESKATQDTWVRIKSGIYKGDLAKVIKPSLAFPHYGLVMLSAGHVN